MTDQVTVDSSSPLDLSAIVKAYDVRGIAGESLTVGVARRLGAAFARLVGGPRVVLGRDMRVSSPELASAFADGITEQGLDVVDIGLASTDLLYFASGWLGLPGAMVTASHNPGHYNGFKLCRAGAVPVAQELPTIRMDAERGLPPARPVGQVVEQDVLGYYGEFLRGLVDVTSIRPLKVVVDAGNAMAALTVPSVLVGVPIELVLLYGELDGTFPNHDANPMEPANVADLCARVVAEGADLGLAFDGDADRCFVVDERGQPVSASAITALVAVRELDREPGATVVHNLNCSRAVPEIISEHGGNPVCTRSGHPFIKQAMARTGAIFGAEHSGHYYFRDFWAADSGMLAALHVLAALGGQPGPLSELLADYQRYASCPEVNCTVSDPAACLAELAGHYAGRPGVRLEQVDGVSVTLANGSWFNVRGSNTEPLLRLNVEAPDPAAATQLRDEVLHQLRRVPSGTRP